MRYLTTGQAADILNVSLTTLQRWAHAGVVTPALTTPGGHYRWDIDDLRQQLQAHPAELGLAALPTIAAAVITATGRVLICERAHGKPPWSFITADAEPGEDAADAAVRAARDVADIAVAAREILGRRPHPMNGRSLVYVAAVPTGPTDVHLQEHTDIDDLRWVTFQEAADLMPDMFIPARDHLARVLT